MTTTNATGRGWAALPTGLPTLAAGHHNPGAGEAGVMEYVSLLAGEPWTGSPMCTHPVIAAVTRLVNDCLPDERRHDLVPLIGRLFGTAPPCRSPERQVLAIRLTVWCARQALPTVRSRWVRKACEPVIEMAAAWCDGWGVSEADAQRATRRAHVRLGPYPSPVAASLVSLAGLPFHRDAWHVEHESGRASRGAAYAFHTDPGALIALLAGLLDEYDRLTGRVEHEDITDAEELTP